MAVIEEVSGMRNTNNSAGFTLLEVIAAMTIVAILAGVAIYAIVIGFASTQRYSNWLTTETMMSKALREICYGYTNYPGVAGALDVEVVSPTELRIVYNDANDRIVYRLADGILERRRTDSNGNLYSGSLYLLLSDVTSLNFERAEDVVNIKITVNRPSLRRKALEAEQSVLIRNAS